MASRIINYLGDEQIYNKEKVDELLDNKQDKLEIDKVVSPNSTNPVENKAVYKGIKDLEDKHDKDVTDLTKKIDNDIENLANRHDSGMQLEADTRKHADDLLEERIDGIEEKVLPMDEAPTEGSEMPAKSGGIFNAIRFASVKIGEIMDWPQFKIETRAMVSDNPFEFTFNGLVHNVAVEPKDVELEIADNVPEGWRAMDGSVELDAATNQELADFFGGRNTTTDGKIWIPYLPRKIIKVAY